MDNYHPFTGRPLTKQTNSNSENKRFRNIHEGKCPYIRKYNDIDIPLGAARMEEVLPETLRQDFIRSFDYTSANIMSRKAQRTKAIQWYQDLDALLTECRNGGLVQCGDHMYLRQLGKCGKCAARQRYEQYRQQKSSTPTSPKPAAASASAYQTTSTQPRASQPSPTTTQSTTTYTRPGQTTSTAGQSGSSKKGGGVYP